MNGPTGCEIAPPLPAVAPTPTPTSPGAGQETPVSFAELLLGQSGGSSGESPDAAENPETSEEPQPVTLDTTNISALFPLFAPLPPPRPPAEPAPEQPGGSGDARATEGERLAMPAEKKAQPAGIGHKMPPEEGEKAPGLAQIAEKGLWKQNPAGGMAAAKQAAMVFTASKSEENAAAEETQPAGHEYPVATEFEKVLPERIEPPARISARSEPPADRAGVAGVSFGLERSAGDFSVADAVVAVEEKHQVVAHTVEEIRGHVQLLRTTGQDRLEVVIRPDAGTELHLAITKADGQIQIQARCERGDFTALEASWTHVQSSLAAQGIRVEALQAGGPSGQPFQQFDSRQEHPRGNREPGSYPIFSEQDTPSTSLASSKNAEWRSRGWQRWA